MYCDEDHFAADCPLTCGTCTPDDTTTETTSRTTTSRETAAAPYKKPKTFPWEKSDEQRTKNCFASKWWGRSKTAMKNSGWKESPMKTECGRVYKLASRIWSEHME